MRVSADFALRGYALTCHVEAALAVRAGRDGRRIIAQVVAANFRSENLNLMQ